MAFGSFQQRGRQALSPAPAPMADINVTPMVDVMLVLLVIFILAAPALTPALKLALALPQVHARSVAMPADSATLAIDAQGGLFWNNLALPPAMLEARLAQLARQTPQPQLQLRVDKNTRYETVARIMAAAQSQGVQRLGFVTAPLAPHLIEEN